MAGGRIRIGKGARKRSRSRYMSDQVMTADRSLRTWDFLSRGALTRWSVPVEGDSAMISLKDLRGAGRVYLTLTDGRQRVSRVINLKATDEERKAWLERVDLRSPALALLRRSASHVVSSARSKQETR